MQSSLDHLAVVAPSLEASAHTEQATLVCAVLERIGFLGEVRVRMLPDGEVPRLLAYFQTPRGLRTLGTEQ